MKYGLLSYQPAGNIGDEIQSIAARQFLPNVDVLIDRDRMKDFQSPEQVKMIINGWYMCEPHQWPPSEAILPFITSVHITQEKAVKDAWFKQKNRHYLLRHGPIGARDAETLALLKEHDIPAYFSGCLTLTLKRNESAIREDYICAVDVSPQVLAYLRHNTSRPIIAVTHWLPRHMKSKDTFVFAEMLLDLYQRAHCVITTRLHATLPCLALETPVLLLFESDDHTRFVGLDKLARHCKSAEFLNGQYPFDLNCPGKNSPDYKPLRASLIENCSRFIGPAGQAAYAAGTIHTFEGLLPFIAEWERLKRFEKALVDLHRGRLRAVLAEIKEFFAKHTQSKRKRFA